jgi:hypothetical protein
VAIRESTFYAKLLVAIREATFYAKLLVAIREAPVHGKLFMIIREAICGSVWVRNVVSHIKGGKQTEGLSEQGAEENIWTEEG